MNRVNFSKNFIHKKFIFFLLINTITFIFFHTTSPVESIKDKLKKNNDEILKIIRSINKNNKSSVFDLLNTCKKHTKESCDEYIQNMHNLLETNKKLIEKAKKILTDNNEVAEAFINIENDKENNTQEAYYFQPKQPKPLLQEEKK